METSQVVILASHREIIRERAALPSPSDHAFTILGISNSVFGGIRIVYIDMNIGMINRQVQSECYLAPEPSMALEEGEVRSGA